MKCTGCGERIDNEWPGARGPICQTCWEQYCDRTWWEQFDRVTRVVAEGAD